MLLSPELLGAIESETKRFDPATQPRDNCGRWTAGSTDQARQKRANKGAMKSATHAESKLLGVQVLVNHVDVQIAADPSTSDVLVPTDILAPAGEAVVEAVVTQITRVQRSHSGPLPDIETLRGYDDLIDKGAERFTQMAEKEQEHSHKMELAQSRRQDGAEIRATIGVVSAFLLGITGFGVAAYMAWLGHPVEGASVATGTFATAFISGTSTNRKEAEKTGEIERSD